MPARTAWLCASVGVLPAVSAAPDAGSTPVTSARWHSAASSEKSALPLEGETPKAQDLAPPTESL